MKRNVITTELANSYPAWSTVRTNDQSVGQQLLNGLATPMEDMQKALITMKSNIYLMSVNLDEIDLSYKVILPVNFSFDVSHNDPTVPVNLPPTISGLVSGVWHTISLASNNDVESFWYTSIPNRITLDDTVSGNHVLTSFNAAQYTASGTFFHHLGGGAIWVETIGGTQYLSNQNGSLIRGRVILHGTNRQGLADTETIIFPWDMTMKSRKEWQELTLIEARDMQSGVDIAITSANFNAEDRLSPWNMRYSVNRNKVDEMWGLDVAPAGNTCLDQIGYVTDEWQQLIQGLIDKEVKRRWELLDTNGHTVTGVDLAIQPYSDNVWVLDNAGQIYCYDIREDWPSGINLLAPATAGSAVQLDIPNQYIVLGEQIAFTPWYARPLKDIMQWRTWYQDPAGNQYGILSGVVVPTNTPFWNYNPAMQRSIGDTVSFTATQRGEYLIVLEAVYTDGTQDSYRALVSVGSKKPLAQMSLSSVIGVIPSGIDFDADQKLWVYHGSNYYQIGRHTDIMLIDYARKLIYFKEPYDEVNITT